jgi:hypothetical protein
LDHQSFSPESALQALYSKEYLELKLEQHHLLLRGKHSPPDDEDLQRCTVPSNLGSAAPKEFSSLLRAIQKHCRHLRRFAYHCFLEGTLSQEVFCELIVLQKTLVNTALAALDQKVKTKVLEALPQEQRAQFNQLEHLKRTNPDTFELFAMLHGQKQSTPANRKRGEQKRDATPREEDARNQTKSNRDKRNRGKGDKFQQASKPKNAPVAQSDDEDDE